MVKKCLLILLVLLCMSACTSKEEKQELDREKQQGTANALLYMKDKYGIQPTVKETHLGYGDASPIPRLKRKSDGTAWVEMMYQERSFTVNVYTDENNQDGSDDYQMPELQEAYRKRIEASLKLDTDLHISAFDVFFQYKGAWYQNVFPKEIKYDGGDIDAFMKDMYSKTLLYTVDEPEPKTLQHRKDINRTNLILLNFTSKNGESDFLHELAKNEISFIDNLSDDGIFIYRDLQKKFAKDLKDSILITNGEEYHTDYTPRFVGEICYYTFDQYGRDTNDTVNIYKGKANPADFRDMKKNYEIHAFSEALTIEKASDSTVLYMPQEDFIKEIPPSQEDTYVVLWQSFINRDGKQESGEFFNTSSTKISEYRDEEGRFIRKSFPQRHPLHYAMQRSVQGKQSNREKGWQYVPIYGMVRVEVKPDSVERRTCNGGCKNKNYECLWCSV